MAIGFDPAKRQAILVHRGVDMALADQVFAGVCWTYPDDRRDYGEDRFITIGWFKRRLMVLVWTTRGEDRRIISMRKANAREEIRYKARLG
jgi:uncharacterized protein